MNKMKVFFVKLLNSLLSFAPIRYIRIEWRSIREVAAIHREHGIVPDELEMEDLIERVEQKIDGYS